MHYILLYLVKLSVCLAVMWLFYQLVLRKLTFYYWNRVYLLACPILSLAIAFIDIGPALQQSNLSTGVWIEWLPPVKIAGSIDPVQHTAPEASAGWPVQEWIIGIILTGMAFFLLRLVILLLSVRKMIKQATPFAENGLRFYQIDANIIPFSFGNAIFLNRDLHSESELQKIIRHESVHIQQMHSIDILYTEVLCILTWYNPFAWLIRKAVRQNLEFIADEQVLQTGIDREQYQYSLLKVAGNTQFSITNNFNFSSLRKRIVMMNKDKTAATHRVKFILLLPLTAVLLLAFRKTGPAPFIGQQVEDSFTKTAGAANTLSVSPPRSVAVPIKKVTIPSPVTTAPPDHRAGFTGLQGITYDSGKPGEDVTPKFTRINGQYHYYTEQNGKITYYNRHGQPVDHTGKLLSGTQTNASEVLPNQYILRVFKDGEIISSFNDDKAWADR
ncbi:MAG: M56 family metallopeptidase [Chitinophagaceae bacterium]|nr:M56 family metallopeptidase [Chitinophagaceae bacterium]